MGILRGPLDWVLGRCYILVNDYLMLANRREIQESTYLNVRVDTTAKETTRGSQNSSGKNQLDEPVRVRAPPGMSKDIVYRCLPPARYSTGSPSGRRTSWK